MVDLVEEIENADEILLDSLLKAVLRRYAVLFPDWEVSTISLQKSHDQNEQLDRIIQLLQNMKSIPQQPSD
ncbi:MAG: hypothetical protein IKK11_01395 [Oscillospiraceae bacterium]|nr:hypothetical protein [Oscillospiraceae bacterium]